MKHPTFVGVIGGGLFVVIIRPPAAGATFGGLYLRKKKDALR
jgi:hypothetical protein